MRSTVAEIAASIPIDGLAPAAMRDTAVAAAVEQGLSWRETVTLVDELERMTGLQLHRLSSEPWRLLR